MTLPLTPSPVEGEKTAKLGNVLPTGTDDVVKALRDWANWMVSCACGNMPDEARLIFEAIEALESKAVSPAMAAVEAERRRQIDVEGWSPEHDDDHNKGQMAEAASCYAHHASLSDHVREHGLGWPIDWPWERSWWRPTTRRRDLVKAGALIIAEIDRLDRAEGRAARKDGA